MMVIGVLGNDERRLALRRAASKKRQGTKSREVWLRLGRERYGDLIFAPALMVDAKLAPGDLDGCGGGPGSVVGFEPGQMRANARAINQEAIDLLCPDGSGRGQLEQTLAHNDELVSHFQNLGDRSGFLITQRPVLSNRLQT